MKKKNMPQNLKSIKSISHFLCTHKKFSFFKAFFHYEELCFQTFKVIIFYNVNKYRTLLFLIMDIYFVTVAA